jgi:hypothetical protein
MSSESRPQFAEAAFWKRVLYMLLFGITYSVAEMVLGLIVLVQFFLLLFTGAASEPLLRLSNNIAAYVRQVFRFLAFNTEEMPFPIGEWPDEPADGDHWRERPAAPAQSDGTFDAGTPGASSAGSGAGTADGAD